MDIRRQMQQLIDQEAELDRQDPILGRGEIAVSQDGDLVGCRVGDGKKRISAKRYSQKIDNAFIDESGRSVFSGHVGALGGFLARADKLEPSFPRDFASSREYITYGADSFENIGFYGNLFFDQTITLPEYGAYLLSCEGQVHLTNNRYHPFVFESAITATGGKTWIGGNSGNCLAMTPHEQYIIPFSAVLFVTASEARVGIRVTNWGNAYSYGTTGGKTYMNLVTDYPNKSYARFSLTRVG